MLFRIEELNRRISGIQDERQKSINELTTLKTRLRELENENIRIQRSLEEKGLLNWSDKEIPA